MLVELSIAIAKIESMTKSINETRRHNLMTLVSQYETDAAFCFDAKIATGYLSQLKMGGKPVGNGRNIGEKLARKIETNLGLERMVLDVSPNHNEVKETTNIYSSRRSKKQIQAQKIIASLSDNELDLILPILEDISSRK